ncbi:MULTISPECIES: glycosyltransferase family 25 protein [Enterobacteriaceae]|uniref:glycosyltransferase family 25 protein n=1 Tax=Enterobacteriaceae TaxID=543 RepID=UPI00182ADFB8|nr:MULTISPECIES: glycosyltransferase family 25 protein [Enterobacteriaceae]EFE9206408.1 glycosyltransferase family 25 protein [Escherichia coli]EFN0013298.1 glycosyltransferase family 25 protein [Escherichia coli]ELF2491463.1 glycosyltransferase family 25 protein [Escherichia coli]EME1184308.1 glycosyltransferase family 25 protein [Escherichia coli]MDE4694457.1 glycosyltransferase family 25 protein [Klebsiella pneumoniae]
MKKIVVSLKHSERRENFDKLFAGLCHEYFDAIVPEDNDPRFDQFIAKSLYGRELRKGEVGCTLSHVEIIKNFSKSDDDSQWLLIMEDDALPEPEFQQFIDDFSKVCSKLSYTPQVILLGHSKTSKKHLFVQRLKQPLKTKLSIGHQSFGVNPRVTMCGTVCYLINKAAAKTIAQAVYPYWIADDWRLYWNLGITILHPIKPLIYESLDYKSSTQNELCYFHNFSYAPINNSIEILLSQCRFYKNSKKW